MGEEKRKPNYTIGARSGRAWGRGYRFDTTEL